MSIKKPIILYVSVFALIVFITLFSLYSIFWYGTITIENIDAYDFVRIDQTTYTTEKLSINKSIKVRPGGYDVFYSGRTRASVSKQVDVDAFSELSLSLNSEELDAKKTSQALLVNSLGEGFSIIESSFLKDSYWLVTFVGSESGTREGFLTIHNYIDGEWVLLESGTGLDERYLREQNYPNEVIVYITRSDD